MESPRSMDFPPSSPPREDSMEVASPTRATYKAHTTPTKRAAKGSQYGLLSPLKISHGVTDALASQLKSSLAEARGMPGLKYSGRDQEHIYNEDLPSSSPPGALARRKKGGIQFTAAAGHGYLTPAPTSSLGRSSPSAQSEDSIASSPLQRQQHQLTSYAHLPQPTFTHSRESFKVRSPLASVFVIPVPRSGREIKLGRSSQSCDVGLSSQNKLISRVHATIEFLVRDGDAGHVKIKCNGWNGCKVIVPEFKHMIVHDTENLRAGKNGEVEEVVSNGQTEYKLPQGQELDLPYVRGITIDVQGERGLIELVDEPIEDETDEEPRTPLRDSNQKLLNIGSASSSSAGGGDDDEFTTPPHAFTLLPFNGAPASRELKKRKSTVAFDEVIAQPSKRLSRDFSSFEPIVRHIEAAPQANEDLVEKTAQQGDNELCDISDNHVGEQVELEQVQQAPLPVPSGVATPELPIQEPSSPAPQELEQEPEQEQEQEPEQEPELTPSDPAPSPVAAANVPHTPSPSSLSKPTQEPSATPTTPTTTADPTQDARDKLAHLVLNHLAFSRLSSIPLTTLRKSSPLLLAQAPDALHTLLAQLPGVGVIERQGKDAAGKLLEAEYYYVADGDEDEDRRAMVEEIKGGAGGARASRLRSCRKVHKQYFWRRPRPTKR